MSTRGDRADFRAVLHDQGTRKGGGLGLAAVYGAVVQNEGCLSVVSEPDRGSTFTVWLPTVESGQSADTVAASHARGAARNRRVLVVDDVPQVRRVAALALRAAGFEVVEADNGADALAQVERTPVDLVLTDVRMPNMDGPQLASALRARHPDLPVLLMTGFADSNTAFALPVLHKPVSSESLVAAVNGQLGLSNRPQ